MVDCVFCKIGQKETDAATVYENDQTIALLDTNPIAEGHTLVVPKKHYSDIFNVDPSVLQHSAILAKKIAGQLRNRLGAEGVNVVNASGQAAEQSVMHFHIHIIPRRHGDRLDFNTLWFPKVRAASGAELQSLAGRLRLD